MCFSYKVEYMKYMCGYYYRDIISNNRNSNEAIYRQSRQSYTDTTADVRKRYGDSTDTWPKMKLFMLKYICVRIFYTLY